MKIQNESIIIIDKDSLLKGIEKIIPITFSSCLDEMIWIHHHLLSKYLIICREYQKGRRGGNETNFRNIVFHELVLADDDDDLIRVTN